jgi:hypothetical protein
LNNCKHDFEEEVYHLPHIGKVYCKECESMIPEDEWKRCQKDDENSGNN